MSFIESYKTCMGIVLFKEQDALVQNLSTKHPEILTINSLLNDARELVAEEEKKKSVTKADVLRLIKLEQTVARLEGALATALAYGLEGTDDGHSETK